MVIENENYSAEQTVLGVYLKQLDECEKLTHNQLIEEYKNINLRDQIIILEDNKISANKLFNLISNEEDYILVENYIKQNCINKYPQTKEDIELISKLNNYKKNYNNENIDIKNQLEMFDKYNISRQKVINSNLRLVVSMAKNYSKFCDLSDLVSAGNEGLIAAVDKFNSNYEYRFSTYASFWIKESIISMINQSNSIIRVPKHIRNNNLKITKKIRQLNMEKGFIESEIELAKELGLSNKEMNDYFKYINIGNMISLNKEINEEGDCIEMFLQDEKNHFEEANNYDNKVVEELLSTLKEKEKFVIEKRLGLYQDKETLQNIADQLNITREGVRLIESRTLAKLKKTAISRHLR